MVVVVVIKWSCVYLLRLLPLYNSKTFCFLFFDLKKKKKNFWYRPYYSTSAPHRPILWLWPISQSDGHGSLLQPEHLLRQRRRDPRRATVANPPACFDPSVSHPLRSQLLRQQPVPEPLTGGSSSVAGENSGTKVQMAVSAAVPRDYKARLIHILFVSGWLWVDRNRVAKWITSEM